MFPPQQIVHCFYRIKGTDGHLYENGVPVAHGTVPQAGKLQGLQFFSVFGFLRNKSGVLIHELGQIELVVFIALHATYQIHGIEMRPVLESIHSPGIVYIDLGTFQNLQRSGSVRIFNNKRTTARLTLVLHHAAHTKWTIKFSNQVVPQLFFIGKRFGVSPFSRAAAD